jgi:large repetitive protein
MPALTHNRVKNGFNGGIRKNNARLGVKNARVAGATNADASRKKAIVGGVGSIPNHIRAAYNRRVSCECVYKSTPILSVITEINTPSNNSTPSYVFSSTETGVITSNKSFTTTSIIKVDTLYHYTIKFNTLLEGTYSDIWVNVTNNQKNVSNKLILAAFTIDTTSPVLAPITPVAPSSSNTTPTFVFNTDEAGTITSNYGFSTTTNAIIGNNTIIFNTLALGTYSDVWVKVTDAVGNVSNTLMLAAFTIV